MIVGRSICVLLLVGVTMLCAPARGGGFDRAIDTVLPRVVKLYGLGAGLQKGYGSGVLVSEDGMVLTVFSLLIDSNSIRAVMADGTAYGASVIARDRDRQLALLQLEPAGADQGEVSHVVGPFPFFDPARETNITPGDWLVAAGNAFKVATGAEPVSIAHGVFSARTRLDARRRLKDFPYRGDVLVIDAITSNPGAPGSALVNLDGEFVGMIGREVISNMTRTHFNWAMPRDVLLEFIQEAMEEAATEVGSTALVSIYRKRDDEPRQRFDTGIRLSRLGYRTVLPFVERVVFKSAADLAGVRPDDLILSMNGRSIPDVADYKRRVKSLAPGESINLVLRRGNTIVAVSVKTE